LKVVPAGLKQKLKGVPLVVEARLALRGLAHAGFRYRCNCCGWKLRAFVESGQFFGASHNGYCPRCDAKARHRRLWLFLKRNGLLSGSRVRLLHVGPWPKIASLLSGLDNVDYVGVDILSLPGVTTIADITSLPFDDASFDALICVHVLEHVVDDRTALSEFRRTLKPGAWAVISVPMRLDRPTHEDSTVTDPKDRKRVFGEAGHVRFYGNDLDRRLEAAGFAARLHLGNEVEPGLAQLHGLRDTDHMFFCTRRASPA